MDDTARIDLLVGETAAYRALIRQLLLRLPDAERVAIRDAVCGDLEAIYALEVGERGHSTLQHSIAEVEWLCRSQ